MRILPLGGADEVGASSYVLNIDDVTIVVDAGIRVGSSAQTGAMPDFDRLPDHIDAILVTHAHADHTGTLPTLSERYPEAPIHTTVGTLHLLEVLQGDVVRRQEDDDASERESDEVSMTAEEVEACIARVRAHPFLEPFAPIEGREDIAVRFVPSGHILGAGMLVIDAPEGRVVGWGDYSVIPQETIGGLDRGALKQILRERRADVFVTEGTYGNSRKHPSRPRETERFLERLENVAARGGTTLIPAFAVGRAQDLVAILRAAKQEGRLPDVPVYVDGMVRPVISIYENLAHQMYPGLDEPLSLLDAGLGIYKANAQSRAKILAGGHPGPAVVIASSGMLIGGRSVEYARALAPEAANAILISGYQDAESPGRALLGLKRGGRLRIGAKESVSVQCEVDRYYTSAHADWSQIRRTVEKVGARKVALVHGEPRALHRLRKKLRRKGVTVLQNGRPYTVRCAKSANPAGSLLEQRGTPPFECPELRFGPSPDEAEVRAAWEHLHDWGEEREYSEAEIATLFLGPGYSPRDRDILSRNLSEHRFYFLTGSRIGQRSYRPRPRDEVADLLIARSKAFQVPLEVGDVVVFSDGSSDLFVAAVASCDGEVCDAVVPFSSRRDFRRDWVCCRTSLSVADVLRRSPPGGARPWLEDVVREARALSGTGAVEVYFELREAMGEEARVSMDDLLSRFFPRREGAHSSGMKVAAGIEVAKNAHLFSLEPDGSFRIRPLAEVRERWPLVSTIEHVRGLEAGSTVSLRDGRTVRATGIVYDDSFEAQGDNGETQRINYRKVAAVPCEPSSLQPVTQ